MFTNRTLLPEDTKRKKTKKNDPQESQQITGIIATPGSDISPASAPASGGGYCSGDQCSLSAHRASLNVQPTDTMTPNTLFGQSSPFDAANKMDSQDAALNNSTAAEPTHNDDSLSEVIPTDLYQMMQNAAKQGMLSSFLLTMSDEFVTAHLKARQYKPEQIYWINQAIRGVELIALGASLAITMATPIANYFLTTCAGMKKEKATTLTTGAALTFGFLTSPAGWVGTSLSMAAGIGASIAGSKATKNAYNLLKNSIFTAKKATDNDLAINTPSIRNSFA